jgi:parvulin-like peptidyl-prolyl isomerase
MLAWGGAASAAGAPAPPASRPADPNVMAYVNGQAIPMRELHDLLVRNYGFRMAQQLIGGELVRQEAERQKITATDAEVRAETDLAMKQIFGQLPAADQRERMLQQLLMRFDVSREHWELSMRRNALLTKLAEKRVKVTEDDLKDEFGRQYGRKAVIRHVQVESWTQAQDVRKALDEGADFVALVRRFSKAVSAKDDGLLPPIDAKSEFVPPVIRQAALAMKKPGETSQVIQAGTAFHIMKLEKIIEPREVKFEDVKDKLMEAVRQRQIAFLKQTIPQELFEKAKKENKIVFVDPVLKAADEMTTEGPKP